VEDGVLVTYGPDVLEKKKEIESRWPELECRFEVEVMKWYVIETCRDGEKRLVFVQGHRELDERVIRRLERADTYRRENENFDELIDRDNAAIEREQDRALEEISGELGERLAHAFKKDGLVDHENIYGPKPKPNLARRDVRIRNRDH
jgi:hypothetical protein